MAGLLVHKHLIVRAEANKPHTNEQLSVNWLYEFIKFINMKPMIGPFSKYLDMPGNRGLTTAAIIETSHCVLHIWDEVKPALLQFDLYSCGEFDPEEICKKITKDFDILKIEYKFLDRENELKETSGGYKIQKERLKDLIVKNHNEKEKEAKEKLLLKTRKEVDINKNGPGYTIKEGPNKGKVLAHIQIPTKNL